MINGQLSRAPISGARLLFRSYWRHRWVFLMLIPALIYIVIFKYMPMYGATLAFKDYQIKAGIWRSPWVGMQYFRQLFAAASFLEVVKNTFIISVYKLIFGFPAPILFAILLSELRGNRIKKSVQTISYLPHFLSWVVLASIFTQFFSAAGPFVKILENMGINGVYLLTNPRYFRSFLVCTTIWKGIGWGSIVYLGSLGNIDTELYDAAIVDGCNKVQKILHVTLPGLTPVITIMLLLEIGRLLNDDFDQIFNLYNQAVYRVADVISTYIYKIGLLGVNYSLATAAGLFKNVLALMLILSANAVTKKINDYGLW